jgi:hypothetical protein
MHKFKSFYKKENIYYLNKFKSYIKIKVVETLLEYKWEKYIYKIFRRKAF